MNAAPAGLTFTDHGNGTGDIGGTPSAGSSGRYPVTVMATSSMGSASESFTIVVRRTSACGALSP